MIQTANYTKAEEKAKELLEEYVITEPVVRADEIAQRKGLAIKYFRPDDNEGLKNASGFFDPNTRTIFVNYEDPPTRQLFTIAHELGHFELGHNPKEYGVLYRFATPIDKDPKEQEANAFAANLLVPEKMLDETMKKYSFTNLDVIPLARLFGVSSEVMRYRLRWTRQNANS
jgi:Zn-dependent peptidase ImmA (M78 family)